MSVDAPVLSHPEYNAVFLLPLVFLFAFGILVFLLVELIALIKRRRWRVITMTVLAAIAIPVTIVFGIRSSDSNDPGRFYVAQLDSQVAQVQVVLEGQEEPKVEPAIDVGDAADVDAPEVEVDESEDAEVVEVAKSTRNARPDWLTAERGEDERLIQVDPRTRLDASRAQAREELAEWGWQLGGGDPSVALPSELVAQIAERLRVQDVEHHETRTVAGGDVHQLWWLGKVDDEDRAWLAENVAHWERASRRTDGVRTVVAGGAGAVTLVALLHGLLRVGSKKIETPTS